MELINAILDGIGTVFDFIITIKDILFTFINFIPNPFRMITIGFLTIWFVIFVWKFKGSGS